VGCARLAIEDRTGGLCGAVVPLVHSVRREILRQHGRLIALLDALDDKNCAKAEANRRLLARRKSYRPKNNGKGRPAKPLQRVSQEDEARRQKYVAEITLLDEILSDKSDLSIISWLKAAHDLDQGDDAAARFRQRKIAQLLDQFGVKTVDLRTPRPWLEKDVRAYLYLARQRQVGRLAYFRRVAARTLAEQEREERERATLTILERLLSSHHVATPPDFLWHTDLLRQDVPPTSANQPCSASGWRDSVDGLVSELGARFVFLETAP
jgi:hypothetical protein